MLNPEVNAPSQVSGAVFATIGNLGHCKRTPSKYLL